jgi:hypothetical protein
MVKSRFAMAFGWLNPYFPPFPNVFPWFFYPQPLISPRPLARSLLSQLQGTFKAGEPEALAGEDVGSQQLGVFGLWRALEIEAFWRVFFLGGD